MSTLNYIRLVNQAATLDRKFRVVMQDFHQVKVRRHTIKEMADGSLDMQHGAHYRVWPFILKVYYLDPDAAQGFGSLANIQTFFDYRLPGNDKLTFYDHLGQSYTVYIDGDYDAIPQSPVLDSENSWFMIPILIRETSAA